MTPDQAWQHLLALVEQSVPKGQGRGRPQLKWLPPNRLLLLHKCDVQARFAAEPGKYTIHFEGFGADLGQQNVDLLPGSGPKHTVWTMLLEVSDDEAFWRFSDGQVLKSTDLALRAPGRLREFHDEYGISVTAPDDD